MSSSIMWIVSYSILRNIPLVELTSLLLIRLEFWISKDGLESPGPVVLHSDPESKLLEEGSRNTRAALDSGRRKVEWSWRLHRAALPSAASPYSPAGLARNSKQKLSLLRTLQADHSSLLLLPLPLIRIPRSLWMLSMKMSPLYFWTTERQPGGDSLGCF